MADTPEDSYLSVEHFQSQTETQPIPRRSCTTKRCIVTAALVLSLSVNAVGVFYWYHHHSQHAVNDGQSAEVSEVRTNTLCTACTDIGVHPGTRNISDLEDLIVLEMPGSSYLCCLQNVEGLQVLLTLFTAQSNTSSRTQQTDDVFSRKTGAHLYLNRDASKRSGSLEWTDESHDSAYISQSVICDNKTLQIKRPGHYHIYSFLTLKTHDCHRYPDKTVHIMTRSNANLPTLGRTTIIMAKKTLPEVSERFGTSYLSATVRLRQGDHVSVAISNMSYVYQHPPSNFFGLYYVGN
ncbi:uncharacterized protein LOC124122938 [Haliotis rufescens]|uniref:uncharacterized protein LOC124122938 n=1 Tax=Haliotis rufescens TaxID=6454 RepID=UPI00201FA365|nr:uncharacterized protein LOC124122938 [Haliotis rufescens]